MFSRIRARREATHPRRPPAHRGRLDGDHADLLIDGDTIVAVLPPGESVTADAKRIDATDRLLIPGLINAHTHATAARQGHRGPLVARAPAERLCVDGGRPHAENKYLSAKIGALEMVRKGCTACYDLARKSRRRRSKASTRSHRPTPTSACARRSRPMMADHFYHAIPGLIAACRLACGRRPRRRGRPL